MATFSSGVKCFRSFLIRSLRYLNGGTLSPVPTEAGHRAARAHGCGRISPCGQQAGATVEEAAEGRKCEGVEGRESLHDTTLLSVGEQNHDQVVPTILIEYSAPDPPLLPSIIFPLGPPS